MPRLVHLLADDDLGVTREEASDPLDQRYVDAFESIWSDANNELVVVERDGEVVGMCQLTFIPYLTHRGSWRCLIEGVRVAREARGEGVGREIMTRAISRARARKCAIVQLTSDKQRPEALRFYELMGFSSTHEGFKLRLDPL